MKISQVHEEIYDDEREEAQQMQREELQAKEDKVRSWVYPLICNMGSFQTIAGKRIYLANPDAGKALKKLSYEMWKPRELERPFIRYYLLEWGFLKDNLLPLIYTQQEDKKMLSEAVRFLWVLSANFISSDLRDFALKEAFLKKRESLVELLYNSDFISVLVQEIETCASAGKDLLESQQKMLRFIFGTILNLLRLDVGLFLPKIVSIFAKDGGMFDSMIYLTQNSEIRPFSELYPTISLIICKFLGHVTPQSLFGNRLERDPEFKRRIDLQRLMHQRRRRNVVSSRHSRFGAMISIKRNDNTSLIVSNPNSLKDPDQLKRLNRREGQLKKRMYGAYQQSVLDRRNQPKYKNLSKKTHIDEAVIHHLKAFLKEFLDFGFTNMATHLEQTVFSLERSETEVREEALAFIELNTFVMQSVLLMR